MTEEKYGDSYGEKFRQYEDKIKELEKENEALKGQMSLHEGILWNDLHKLEKKNAELKKQLDWKEKALAKAKKETKRIANRVNKDKRRLIRRKLESADMLAKAKEIIKKLMVFAEMDFREYEKEYKEAEQFLKEE